MSAAEDKLLHRGNAMSQVRVVARNRKRRWRLLTLHGWQRGSVFRARSPYRKDTNPYGALKLPQRLSSSMFDKAKLDDGEHSAKIQNKDDGCSRETCLTVSSLSSASSSTPVSEELMSLTCLVTRSQKESTPPAQLARLSSPSQKLREVLSPCAVQSPSVWENDTCNKTRTSSRAFHGAARTDADVSEASPPCGPSSSPALSLQTDASASVYLNPPTFADLGVPPALLRMAAALHITRPSPIQVLTLPRALRGGDLCGVAPTGTGKTLCYCWPLLHRVASGNGHAFLGLVLLPARELVVQVLEQFRVYGASLGVRVCVLLGGRDLTEEGKVLLHRAPHILIATPGRLADIVQNNLTTMHERLSVVEVLVLDEADMLLSEEFKEDLKSILACLPPSSAAVCSAVHMAEIADGESSLRIEPSLKEAVAEPSPHRVAGEEVSGPLKRDREEKQQRHHIGCASKSAAPSAGRSTSDAETRRIYTDDVPRLRRQTLLFSATLSPALLALQQQRFGDVLMPLFDASAGAAAAAQLHSEIRLRNSSETEEAELATQPQVLLPRLSHFYVFVPTAVRFQYLLYLLEHVAPYSRDRGIIFAGSVRQTQRLCTALQILQQEVTSLHSLMKQRTRLACLEKFRSEVARLLVCTDVASRGLDLPRVDFVICLDVPHQPQEPSAVRAVHRIEAYIDTKLQPLPNFKEEEALQRINHHSRVLQRAALFLNEIGFDEMAEQHEAYTKALKELRKGRKDAAPLSV